MLLAVQEMKYAKLRYSLIGFIMALIVWLVLFVSGLAQGLAVDNASAIQQMSAHYFVIEKDADGKLSRSILSERTVEKVEQYVQKTKAVPVGIYMTGVTSDNGKNKTDATFFGIEQASYLDPKVVEGKAFRHLKADEVVVDQSFKQAGFHIGDRIKDERSGITFTIKGFSEKQTFSHTPVIHVPLDGWRNMQKEKHFFTVIALTNTEKVKKIEDELSNVKVITKDEALKGIPGYKEEQSSLQLMIVFLFIIAAILSSVFFYVITIQKINQFGILKAIGATFSYLAKTIFSQVFLLTSASVAVGVICTYGMSLLLPESIPFELPILFIWIYGTLFIVLSMLGTFLSLYQVAKVDAIDAIGRVAA
ncbi:ABC transporter permease [Anoxybacillus eryuanensis]|uniref:ABC transporter permease n=1 Tax=Anoxybacillus eryuanensis TaxID=651866 RepID=UPI003EF4ADE6